ncbi:MAG TPA: acyltransferase family protein [Methanomassiliicoccales archaeon]|jgi:peptidoglycan/LPS O-acetylase OafA/YrhL
MNPSTGRLHYIDNLRWTLIILVIVVHASATYGPVGGWFYYDRASTDAATGMILTWIPTVSQTFFMGLMFFLAGYFIPSSLERKGKSRFVAERLKRLGIPVILFIIMIGPGIVYFLNYYGTSFFDYYLAYLVDPERYQPGPLWFAIVLLIFTLVYVGVRKHLPILQKRTYGNRELLALGLMMAVGSFMVRIVYPIGSNVWIMQVPFFFQYVILFALGIMSKQNGWLDDLPMRAGKIWKYLTIVLAILAWPVLVFSSGMMDSDYTSFMGGLNWQALALAIWEQTFCVAASVSLLVWYKNRMNFQSRSTRFLSENAFAVYFLHAPILVVITLLLVNIDLPIILKFVSAVVLAIIITYCLCDVLRRSQVFHAVFG